MDLFTEKLLEEMIAEISRVKREVQGILEQAERCYRVVYLRMEELRGFILGYQYESEQEEIRFFKKIKPKVLSELMYYAELFEVEAHLPVGSPGKQKKHYTRVLDRIALFFDRHHEFYTYHRTGKTELDEQLFLNDEIATPLFPDVYTVDTDPRFFRPASYRIARIMAYERLHCYVLGALTRLKTTPPAVSGDNHPLNWTGKKSDLIELVYGIQARGIVNNGNAEIRQLITGMEYLFNVQLGNFYRTFQNMRERKKDRTPFLRSLIESVEQKMDDLDINY